jgi:CHC2 zinc finger/Toprim domain
MITAPRIEDEIARRGIKLRGRGPERCGPCPVCGGRDRFSINVKKQLFNCRGCGRGGDVLDLIQHLDGVDFVTARRIAGCDEARPVIKPRPKPKIPEEDNGARALAIWRETDVLGPLALSYFERRKLGALLPLDHVIRFHPACPFNGGGNRCPCVVALYRNIVTNAPQAIHRTALGDGGIKLGCLTYGPTGGAAIKLSDDTDVEQGLTIGEGIETTMAGMLLGFRPAWATGCAGSVANFPVLAGVEALTILVDNDKPDHSGRQAGQAAATACWRNWVAAGREVIGVTTTEPDSDIADVLERPS